MSQFKYEEITKKIISAVMKVNSTLGNGFQEVIGLQPGSRVAIKFWYHLIKIQTHGIAKFQAKPNTSKIYLIDTHPRSDK